VLLFSESNTRFLCEIRPENAAAWETAMNGIPHGRIGEVLQTESLQMTAGSVVIDADLKTLKEAWQNPLRW
jgi:phosphoribosylformylglycinamidine synthase